MFQSLLRIFWWKGLALNTNTVIKHQIKIRMSISGKKSQTKENRD